jgi:hypothetical protein
MALNLGATLRDVVDGPEPGLDDVAGEDPADVDLPALSARIRHRRRVRAATRSAAGVAAAGVVALVGVQGLGGRGTEALTNPPAAGQAPLAVGPGALCGLDVTRLPTLAGGLRLVPSTVPVVGDASGVRLAGDTADLGTLAGRRLTATLVEDAGAPAVGSPWGSGEVVLTQGSTVVAHGMVQADAVAASLVMGAASASAATVSEISAYLVSCATPGGAQARVPAGTYTVQYVVPVDRIDAATGERSGPFMQRPSTGPWRVTLLDEPPSPSLPEGYPSADVPVVGGDLLSATPAGPDGAGWTVRVAVDGDDGLTRAATLLGWVGADPNGVSAGPDISMSTPDASSATQPDVLSLQVQLAAATQEMQTAQKAYDDLLSAYADPETMAWAARQLQAARGQVAALEAQSAAAEAQQQEQATSSSADQPQQAETSDTWTIAAPSSLEALTPRWSVVVTRTVEGGRTVLTYAVTRR